MADIVAAVDPGRFNQAMRVRYTGDLITSAEEYDAIVRDLGEVGAWGVAGVLVSVLLFFLRLRTVLVLAASLSVGLLWSFGITRFTIGYLNSSSGFLVSVIAGNGINLRDHVHGALPRGSARCGCLGRKRDSLAHRDTWIPPSRRRRPQCSPMALSS